MHTSRVLFMLMLLLTGLVAGCAMKPAARMDAYVGPTTQQEQAMAAESLKALPGPLEVGVLVINDTSAQGSAPALSDKGREFLTDKVRQRIEEKLPLRLVKVLPATDLASRQDPQLLARLAQEQGVGYLLLAIFSSAESEIPLFLPLDGAPEQGGSRAKVSGFEAINYALAELALLDVKTGQVMLRADGRAWSKLNRLYVPVLSNSYPVIHRSLRIAPIYPKEENAKDMLRGIAGDEALEQAVFHLEMAWPKPSAS